MRFIRDGYLARVEGEGGMDIRIRDGCIERVHLRIFESPRFFEAFLRGRRMEEAIDITSRICGICPVAYQMSSAHAMENVCGIRVGDTLRELRRLLYCGEWIESHALHTFMLHLPDFLGYDGALEMATDYPDEVSTGLRLKKLGNDIMRVVGGREIHPINVKVGGFYKAPTSADLNAFIPELEWARDAAVSATELFASLDFPPLDMDWEVVALSHPDEYAMNEGRIRSNRGLDIDIRNFNDEFEEIHEKRSNALRVIHRRRGPYHVGPIARYTLNHEHLTPLAAKVATRTRLGERVTNPYRSIVVRGVEIVYACEEALRIISQYACPPQSAVPVRSRAGVGYGCTEAPRGLLLHRYRIDDDGLIREAQIVPPTAQNQAQIEEDLRTLVADHIDLTDDKLSWYCEQAIRNYDPCISCATHFLDLRVVRDAS